MRIRTMNRRRARKAKIERFGFVLSDTVIPVNEFIAIVTRMLHGGINVTIADNVRIYGESVNESVIWEEKHESD